MTFHNPMAFIGFLSVPVIIAMYLLKQKYKEYRVPSLFLWNEALAQSHAQKPWQKLRRSLLMFLQLAAAVILTLALAEPAIVKNAETESYIFVMDMSMSMMAGDEKPNRFEKARESAVKIVNNMPPGSAAAIVAACNEPFIVSGYTDDKNNLINKLNELAPAYASIDRGGVLSLVDMLREQDQGTVYIFSDGGFDLELDDKQYITHGGALDNTAITLVSHSADGDRIICLVRVKNYGAQVVTDSVSLYADDKINDVKQFTLMPGEERDVFFTSVPGDAKYLKATLSDGDMFPFDDIGYDAADEAQDKRVLLITSNNVFLENMLSILPGLEVYKAGGDPGELKGYYLYVFDGTLPEVMPSDGHILIFNPPEGNSFINTEGDMDVSGTSVRDNRLLAFITDLDFSISKSKRMSAPDWAYTVLAADGYPIIFAGEEQNRKVMVMGFDLHNTDLPLRKEYPIFMYNLMQWFIPSRVTVSDRISSGDTVEFNLLPDVERANIITPSGELVMIAPPFPSKPYKAEGGPGIYMLEQYTSGGDRLFSSFPVNVTDEESDLIYGYGASTENSSGQARTANAIMNRSLKNIFLIILLCFLAAEYAVYLKQYRLNRFGKVFTAMVRSIIILLIALTLAGVTVRRHAEKTATVFVYDLSSSMKDTAGRISDVINEAIKSKTENDLAGAVSFGENAVIDALPSAEYFFSDIESVVRRGFTNIADGLRMASTILPEDTKKRITLFSDGRENVNDALAQAKILGSRGITLDVFPISNNIEYETQITSVYVPKTLNIHLKYDIEIIVHSLKENNARLTIYKNDMLITTEQITVRAGENRYVFTDAAETGGGIVYRAEIQPSADTFHQNNIAYAYSYAEDAPNILVADYYGSSREIMKMLEGTGLNAVRVNAMALPVSLDRLSIYDALILPDIAIDDMPDGMPELIESYVKDAGGGLMVTGGENTYALGGYHKTPLETALPVDMQLKDKENAPNLGMIIVTDRSGSMGIGNYGVSKLALAKEAAIRSVDALDDIDYLGVLAFDDGFIWASDFQPVQGMREIIKNDIACINLGGGTSILPGLYEAYSVLSRSDTKLKHIILLTDGQAEQTGYDAMLRAMNAEGITLSTVAVGSDADLQLLQSLAQGGGGRYYYTDEFTDLPKIFAKETFLAGKNYIRNESFFPAAGDRSSILTGISALPRLNGYIALTKKDRADAVLIGPDNDPILASWQYGLGRAVAWTPDMNGRWTDEWLAADEGVSVFRNMLSWIIRKPLSSEANISAKITGDQTEVTLSIPYSEGIRGVTGVLVSATETTDGADGDMASMKRYEVEFRAVSPGEYKTFIPESMAGAYIAGITLEKISGAESIVTGFSISYPPEFDLRLFSQSGSLLERLAAETGGRMLTDPADIFVPLPSGVFGGIDIGGFLLTAALLIFLLDIAARRFPAALQRLEAAVAAVRLGLSRFRIQTVPSVSQPSAARETIKPHPAAVRMEKSTEKPKEVSSTSSMLLSGKNKRTGSRR